MQHVHYVVQVVILFLVYFFTAELGLSLDAVSRFASLVWIPTGISLVALLLFGFRLWPGIAAAAFLVNFLVGGSILAALGIAVGNTLEALVGAYLLQRMDVRTSLDRLRDVILLIILAAVGSTILSATIGVSSLWLAGLLSTSAYLHTWTAWWVGDMLSNLLVAPLLLVWSKKAFIYLSAQKRVEFACLLFLLILLCFIVFRGFLGIIIENSPVTYLVIPLFLWVSLRFTQRESVTAVFVLAVLAIWGTSEGQGPFAQGGISSSLFYLQGFIGVIAITSMVLSAVVSERRELERRKNEFISMASHELKTPITIIKLYTQVVQKEMKELNHKKAMEISSKYNAQIDRLTLLVNDLLDVSKIVTGKFELRKSDFEINKLVNEVVSQVEKSYKKSSIILQNSEEQEVYADKDRIGQVVLNLLMNAIKYSDPSETITIQIKLQKKSVTISIQDFGIGIAKEHQDEIFDRFFQINPLEKASPGLGIGLYLSKMIVTTHGGEIWVKSKKGHGAIFAFSLPLKKERPTE